MVEYCIIESEKVKTHSDDSAINLVLQTFELDKQVLVFNNSKRSSETTAEKIANAIKDKDVKDKDELKEIANKILKSLANPTKQCQRLAKCVEKGVGFHHSGLVSKQRDLIEKNFKKGLIRVISSTPTLCLAKGTQIWTNGEKVLIENFKKNKVHALKGSNLFQIKPLKIENNGFVDTILEIESVSGHKIKSTLNHKFFVKRNGKKLILPASKIRKTDLIATVGKIDIDEKKIYFSDLILDNKLPFEDKEISTNTYYLIGAMLGDGYSGAQLNLKDVFYKGSPCLVGIDSEVFQGAKIACKEIGISTKEEKNSSDIPELILGKNNWFREFLVRSGVDLGINKQINEKLKSLDKEKISNLLQGLFDTDGYSQKKGNIGYSSISLKLIKDIQFCLYRFNIVSSIRKRTKKSIKISEKTYDCKELYELIIAENTSILNFYSHIGFRIERKQKVLDSIVVKIKENVLFKKCENCNYLLYRDLFGGRTKDQIKWGQSKLKIIDKLSRGPLTSNELKSLVGGEIRKNSSRLNHHYQLITKDKKGSVEWNWNLNKFGRAVALELNKSSFQDIFRRDRCLVCDNNLTLDIRKSWKNSNKEEDIYWDQIRDINEIKEQVEVFDVVLPSDGSNDHMFVAEGFITHNSAGLNLPAYKVIIKDYKRYSQRGFNDIPILEFHQMSGRAGRPGSESIGKAVLCVKTESEIDRVVPKYVFGKSEEIISKLAVEPTLKMYTLSLIAMDVINTKDEIRNFFSSTLYAHQYKDLEALSYNVFRIIEILKEYNFVNQVDDYYMATALGKKVSELLINPDTANYFIVNLEKFITRFESSDVSKYDVISLIHFIVSTIEMKPLFKVYKADEEQYVLRAGELEGSLIVKFDPFEVDYESFLDSIKTTDILMDWIREAPEDYIYDKYKVTPGELNYKVDTIDWLLYSLEEISYLRKHVYFKNYLNKLRIRFKFGIKEELLPLINLKGVGRVRARKLYNAGFKKILDLKKAEFASISRVVGESITIKIKTQITDGLEEKSLDFKPKEIKAREVSDDEIEQLVINYKDFEKEKKEQQFKLTDYF